MKKGYFDVNYFIDNKCPINTDPQSLQFYLSADGILDNEKDVLLMDIKTSTLFANSNLHSVVRLPLSEKTTVGVWHLLIQRGREGKSLISQIIVIQQ